MNNIINLIYTKCFFTGNSCDNKIYFYKSKLFQSNTKAPILNTYENFIKKVRPIIA